MQGRGAGAAADRMLELVSACEGRLEPLHGGAEHVGAALQHVDDGGIDLRLDGALY